ncbi:unnamed protein product [Rhodiola kirilowii]
MNISRLKMMWIQIDFLRNILQLRIHLITMHANCCFGLQRKIDDLKVILHDWKIR